VYLVELWLLEKQLWAMTFEKVALKKAAWDSWKPIWLSCCGF
jgi:hypothetical protein